MINFTNSHLVIGLIILAITLIVLWKQQKSFSYLLFFAIFWIYLLGVVSVIVFPFPVGYDNPDFRLNINFIPFSFGSCFNYMPEVCFRIIYENILLTIPFGFGISFIIRIKPRNIFWLAIAVGFTFEIIQLVISLIVRNSFRSVDINDVILNAIGALVGYAVFRIF